MTNLLGLIFDGGLAVLLIVTIGYCSRLSHRIRQMQDSRGELASTIAQFDQATSRATASLTELQTVARRITEALQLKIEKANFMADDLAFLIEKSSKLLVQLEQTKAESAPRPRPSYDAQPLKPKPVAWQPPQPHAPDSPSSSKSAASLEALLNQLAASAGTPSATTAPKPAAQPQTVRTGAERELLAALKTGSR